jgi:RND family efflux transporter MFP subunit
VRRSILALSGLGAGLFGLVILSLDQKDSAAKSNFSSISEPSVPITIPGTTQCSPKGMAILAPAVLHPVEEIFVALGDKVKKGQPVVRLDDDEPQADVRVKKANLENVTIAAREAKRYLASLEKLHLQGAVPEQRIHEARANSFKAEAEERAAKAAVDVAMAELEHYLIAAPIDGIVNRLDVRLGMVSRPGTTEWGEILDLREIDVRLDIPIGQIDKVKVGDQVKVMSSDLKTSHGAGRIVFLGLIAKSGQVPALVRLANEDGKLRCEIPVNVHFSGAVPRDQAVRD